MFDLNFFISKLEELMRLHIQNFFFWIVFGP
jgi:hypothetical protein